MDSSAGTSRGGSRGGSAPTSARRESAGADLYRLCAEDHCDAQSRRCGFAFTLKVIGNEADPTRRYYEATYSRPHKATPVPLAVVAVTMEMRKLKNTCVVTKYRVEANRLWVDGDTPLDERWLDDVVRRKLALRSLMPLGTEFTDTRAVRTLEGSPLTAEDCERDMIT